MYHAKDGWCFERLADGAVRMTRQAPVLERPMPRTRALNAVQQYVVLEEVRLSPDTWASIVAAVSCTGETGESFHAAQALHQGGNPDSMHPVTTFERNS